MVLRLCEKKKKNSSVTDDVIEWKEAISEISSVDLYLSSFR